jgi:hypothetical protein
MAFFFFFFFLGFFSFFYVKFLMRSEAKLTFKARVMQALTIKSHRVGTEYSQPHLFILNKGNNSGKPLNQACPNCFVCLLDSTEEREQLFWLLYGLWRSNSFYQHLRGSVIPFIVKNDLKSCIANAKSIIATNPVEFQKSVTSLRNLENLEATYRKNILLIDQAKKTVFHQYLSKP